MTETTTSIGTPNVGSRAAPVKDLKVLKSPEEGGTKKEYEDFLERIQNHVVINWDFGKDIGYLVKNTTDPTFEEPKDLSTTEEGVKWKVRLWNREVDRYGLRMCALEENKGALYALIVDAVSKLVKSKLKSNVGYTNAEDTGNAIWLLNTLEDIMVNFEEIKPKARAMDDQMERIMRLKQGDSTNEDFMKLFQKEVKVYAKHGGEFLWGSVQDEDIEQRLTATKLEYKTVNKVDMPTNEADETEKIITKTIREEILALAILKRADKKQYGNLQISLNNSYLLGKDEYPTTIPEVLKVLNNYQSEWGHKSPFTPTKNSPTRTPVSFFQTSGESVAFLRGNDNSFFSEISCCLCGNKGHYQYHCPVAINKNGDRIKQGSLSRPSSAENGKPANSKEVRQFRKKGILLRQHDNTYVNPNWVLLDSESTDHIFCNSALVTDVGPTADGEVLRLHSSGGHFDTSQKGSFGGFSVWYNPYVLSLAMVTDQYRVSMDTAIENAINVHISSSHVIKFLRAEVGLYILTQVQLNCLS